MTAFYEEQFQTLTSLGMGQEEAHVIIATAMRRTPTSADTATYIPAASMLIDQIDHAAVMDARASWYKYAPDEYKRLLDTVDSGVQ